MKTTLKPIKKPPYFQKGVLAFENSGHTLTRDKIYYVCSQKQKGKCKEGELRINAVNVQKAFSRMAEKFSIPSDLPNFTAKRIIGPFFHGMIDELIGEGPVSEVFGTTLPLIQQDLKEGKARQYKIDLKEAKQAFLTQIKEEKLPIAVSIVIGTIITFSSNLLTTTEKGRTLSYLCKKVFLDEKGHIKKIKLCALGNYAFQYVRKYCPSYTEPFKYICDAEKFESFEFKDMAKLVKENELGKLLTYDAFASSYATIKYADQIFKGLARLKPEQMVDGLLLLDASLAVHLAAMTRRMFDVPKNI